MTYIAQKLFSNNTGVIWDNPLSTFRGPVVFEDTVAGAAFNSLINYMEIVQTNNNLVLAATGVPSYLTLGNYTMNTADWPLPQKVTVDNTVVLGDTHFRFPQKGKAIITWRIDYLNAMTFPQQYSTFLIYHPLGTAAVGYRNRTDGLMLLAGSHPGSYFHGTCVQEVAENSTISMFMHNTENNNSVLTLKIIFILDS